VNVPMLASFLLDNTFNTLRQVKEYSHLELERIIFSDDFLQLQSQDRYAFLEEKCTITEEDIRKIAKITVGQMKNRTYCKLRQYRITASNVGKVVKAIARHETSNRAYPPSLFKTLLGNTIARR